MWRWIIASCIGKDPQIAAVGRNTPNSRTESRQVPGLRMLAWSFAGRGCRPEPGGSHACEGGETVLRVVEDDHASLEDAPGSGIQGRRRPVRRGDSILNLRAPQMPDPNGSDLSPVFDLLA